MLFVTRARYAEHMQVGSLLKQWRRARRMSQQDLAMASEVSTRHISFVENGKSSPSREMVLVLASALDMPLRERNVLLASAGFAPAYRESKLSDPDMAGVRQVLDIILEHQEPYPAIVLDHVWNLVRMNAAGMRVLGRFLGERPDPALLKNVMHALFHPDGFRPWVVNFDDVASAVIDRLYREAMIEPEGSPARTLLAELEAYEGVSAKMRSVDLERAFSVAIPLHLRKGDVDVRFLTTITTLGTPLDVTAQELRIESYFPADAQTRAWVESLAPRAVARS